MTLADWTALYSRLCAGLSRKENPAQLRAYFDALSAYPQAVVSEAVRMACSRTWPPTHPHAGDVVELAGQVLRARQAPAAICDVCGGSGWVEWPGAPVKIQMPIFRPGSTAYVESDWTPQFAHRCPQCRPVAEPAA